MAEDRKIRQGPHTQLKEVQQVEFEMMLSQDRKAEKRLARMEVLTLVAAVGIVVVCHLIAMYL